MSPRATGAADPELLVRRGLLLVVAAAALTSVLAGLGRLGFLVAWGPGYAFDHGPLFVLGTFGTVISLERAVALGRSWGFLAPALGAATAIAILAGSSWATWTAVGSALALLALNGAIVRRQSAPFTWLMLLGSVALLVGDVVWALERPVFEAVPSWVGFFVLTIVAERLELSRLAPTPRWASQVLVVLAGLLAVLIALLAVLGWDGSLSIDVLLRPLGVTLALIAAWQLRFDLARRTVRGQGLPRFAALGVLLGAAWLLGAGALIASLGLPPAGPRYDAALHAVFVGYVLSMVFAHAPIILPAVARVNVPFTPLFYLPLAVLHLGLAARVAGDLLGDEPLRRAGGIANAVALGLFVLAVIGSRSLAEPERAPKR